MRVLFTVWSWTTHLYPLVPVAWAFRSAGHEVLVAVQPALVPRVQQAGLPVAPVGTDVNDRTLLGGALMGAQRAARPDPGRPRLQVSVRMAEAMVDDLLELARCWRPDLVVSEPTTYAAPLVSAVVGIPYARYVWGIDVHAAAREHEPAAFAPLCARLGLAGFDARGNVTLDPCPERLQIPGEGHREQVRFVPYNGPGAMPGWLLDRPARPRVCVTGGLSRAQRAPAGDDPESFIRRAVRALAPLDVEVVAAVSASDQLALRGEWSDQAPKIRIAELLPLHLLLPSCGAVVAPGGNGTMMTAVMYGVPQVCVPQQRADDLGAAQLEKTGAGIRIADSDACPAALRDAVERVLGQPGYGRAADALRAQAQRRPPLRAAVAAMERLVAQGNEAD
jgi:UDP:flavonoid glycosyltransferase YjiC (YdhE family)